MLAHSKSFDLQLFLRLIVSSQILRKKSTAQLLSKTRDQSDQAFFGSTIVTGGAAVKQTFNNDLKSSRKKKSMQREKKGDKQFRYEIERQVSKLRVTIKHEM
jgi:NH3-dependent NAD+ synthetase